MALLLAQLRAKPGRPYLDRSQFASLAEQDAAKAKSRTVYVENLAQWTLEEQIHELFSRIGTVKRVIMGLNRVSRKPCGFCFVEYESRTGAVKASQVLNGARFDSELIKVEIDPGFREGRQFGRARSGGQIRNEVRVGFAGGAPGGGGGGWAPPPRSGHGAGGGWNRRGAPQPSFGGPPARWVDPRAPPGANRDRRFADEDRFGGPAPKRRRHESDSSRAPPRDADDLNRKDSRPGRAMEDRSKSKQDARGNKSDSDRDDSEDSEDEEVIRRRRDRRRRRRERNRSDSDSDSDSD